MNHKYEIIKTRKGGLGSSDAQMILRIAKNECVSESDNSRIAVMLGYEEQMNFTSIPMEYGNIIEDAIFNHVKYLYPNAVSNPYYKSEKLSYKFGFDVFSHIDYEIEYEDMLMWIEVKATQGEPENAKNRYGSQLQWHHTLLKEKAKYIGKKPLLVLFHYQVADYNEFNIDNLTVMNIVFNPIAEKSIIKGLGIIRKYIKNFRYVKREEINSESLPSEVQDKLRYISDCITLIDETEKKVQKFKDYICAVMEQNNVRSIKNDYFSITYIPEQEINIFDMKRFVTYQPEMAQKYQKKSKRKSYVKISKK